MAATPPTPPMFFIPSEDIELSQEERITLAYARWNEASAANENPSQAKLARQYGIPSSTLWDRINGRKTAAARNQQFQRLSLEEEEAICDWILRLQAWGWPLRVKQVRSIAKELLIRKSDDKSVEINWPQKFLNPKTSSANQNSICFFAWQRACYDSESQYFSWLVQSFSEFKRRAWNRDRRYLQHEWKEVYAESYC